MALRAAEETLTIIVQVFGAGSPEVTEAERHLAVMRAHCNGEGDIEKFFAAESPYSDIERKARALMEPEREPGEDREDPKKPQAIAYTFDELLNAQFPARPALLCCGQEGIIRAGSMFEIVAARGLGKSLLVDSLALALATGGDVCRWHAPEPIRVLVIDGEMPGPVVQDRLRLLAAAMGIESAPNLRVLAADWQEDYLPRLDTVEGQAFVEPWLDGVDAVLLDNRSCLFDPAGENDPEAWAPAQAWLLSLRRRGIAQGIVHHANRQGGSRGHSKPEDLMDVILKLTRPDDYRQDQGARFTVTFDKARGFFGESAAPFVAHLVDGLWRVEGAPESGARKMRQVILTYIQNNPGSSKGRVVGNVAGREQGVRKMIDDLTAEGVLRKEDGRFYTAASPAVGEAEGPSRGPSRPPLEGEASGRPSGPFPIGAEGPTEPASNGPSGPSRPLGRAAPPSTPSPPYRGKGGRGPSEEPALSGSAPESLTYRVGGFTADGREILALDDHGQPCLVRSLRDELPREPGEDDA